MIAQSGTKGQGSVPETQFQVEVLDSIKGQLSGTMIVNQQGGYKDHRLILMEGDKLLMPGKTYLFATKKYAAEGWHTLVPKYGDIPIESAADHSALAARFIKAVKEQVSLPTKKAP